MKMNFKKNVVISFSFGNYRENMGGTDKVIKEQKYLITKENISFVHIYPIKKQIKFIICNVWGVLVDDEREVVFHCEDLLSLFYSLQENHITICAILVHHTMSMDLEILTKFLFGLAEKSKIIWYIHDYFSVCPQQNLLKNDIVYCGVTETNISVCNNCKYLKIRRLYRENYLSLYEKFGDKSIFLIPSETAKDIFLNNFSGLKSEIVVMPHQKLIGVNYKYPKAGVRLNIAFLGLQNKNKGYDVWKKFVHHNNKYYNFYYLGEGNEAIEDVINVEVSFQKNGNMDMTNKLINYGINIVFLWSICPETYSFTYYEALAANCFVVTGLVSGNIRAMVEKKGNGIIYSSENQCILDSKRIEIEYRNWYNKKVYGPKYLMPNDDILNIVKCKSKNENTTGTILKYSKRRSKVGTFWGYIISLYKFIHPH